MKKIIITGASSGIGLALAEHLSSLGHHVIAVARRREPLETLQKSYPLNITIVIADITKTDERLKIKDRLTIEDTGVYLIHNAGIAIPRLLSDISETEWDQHYLTNTKAPLFLTQLLLPHLKNGGRVLHISSGLAHTPSSAMAAYGVSKAALLMSKEYFNAELNQQGIHYASAMPGVVDTPIQTHLRSCDSKQFPAVEAFLGFFQRGELLHPRTAAKFLSWLLLHVDDDQFAQGDWNIYDTGHHEYWAMPGEVKQRKKAAQELTKSQREIPSKASVQSTAYSFYLLCIAGVIAIIVGSQLISTYCHAENTYSNKP